MTSPPHQHRAAATPALRGPTRSSHPPQSAEAVPRNTKNSVNIHPSSEIFQSQLVVKMVAKKPRSFGQSIGFVRPIALCSGSQNTENPYAMPMHRWIARAHGGTSQRLKPGLAIRRCLSRRPGAVIAFAADITRSLFCVVGGSCPREPVLQRPVRRVINRPILCFLLG